MTILIVIIVLGCLIFKDQEATAKNTVKNAVEEKPQMAPGQWKSASWRS